MAKKEKKNGMKIDIDTTKKTEISSETSESENNEKENDKDKGKKERIPLTANLHSQLFKKSRTSYVLYTGVLTGKGFDIFRTTKIKPSTNCILIDNKKDTDKDAGFPFDIQKDVFHLGNTYFFLLDINVGQLTLNGKDTPDFNPILLAKLVKDKVIAQYTTRLTDTQKKVNITIGIFAMILGCIIGFMVGKWNVLFPS